MKARKKLVRQLRNKGGKAFIFNFGSIFRLAILLYDSDTITRVKIRFASEARATKFAKKVLNNARAERLLEQLVNKPDKSNGLDYYPVYRWEYKHSIVNGHDDAHLSYWYKKGAGAALGRTRRSVPSWCMPAV